MEIKSDIKTAPFYPGLISEEQQDTVRKSDLWPILLSLHFNTGGKIFITEAYFAGHATKIHFRTLQGAHILGVKKSNGDISLYLSADIIWSVLSKQDLIYSNNPKYIVNKLKQNGDAIQRIKTHIQNIDRRLIPEVVQKLVRGFAGQIKEPGTDISVGMTAEVQEYAIRALFNGTNLMPEPVKIKEMQGQWARLQDSDAKKLRYQKKYLEMFGPLKHLLIHVCPLGLNIVGTVKEICRESDYKVKVVVPQDLHIIKNISDDPQLMASLAFWKILRESRKDCNYPTLGTDGMLINNTNLVDLEAGSMINGEVQDNKAYGIYLIHKVGEHVAKQEEEK